MRQSLPANSGQINYSNSYYGGNNAVSSTKNYVIG